MGYRLIATTVTEIPDEVLNDHLARFKRSHWDEKDLADLRRGLPIRIRDFDGDGCEMISTVLLEKV